MAEATSPTVEDGNEFAPWIGKTETLSDVASALQAEGLAATLDQPAPEGPFGELLHWLHFLPRVRASEIDVDGHPRRGGFLPPVPLERRMWAAGRLRFLGRYEAGATLEKRSEILKVAEKTGKTGRMVFVTVGHRLTADGRAICEEEQDIVYLPMPERFSPPPAQPLPDALDWSRPQPVDTVTLFRFSALTFNAHRIHFDLPYATGVEKYPGLIVHGPLQAIWLLEEAKRRNPGRVPATFSFRGVHPLFAHDAASLNGGGDQLFVAAGSTITMRAEIGWEG